ncbi:peptidoglycan DD-metalloendopeptidase family protein [Sorangium sp. So ce260]|uniref:M23 family metallopeptidase n=1 Tax=Sorangium sp. So ce260 TaxID=3133291 RepID=UPI003F64813E
MRRLSKSALPAALAVWGICASMGDARAAEGATAFWNNPVEVAVSDGALTRGPGWGWSAGASSVQQIEAGDGFVEFSTNEADRTKIAGLSRGDDNQSTWDIDHGVLLRADGGVEVIEQGVGQGYFGTYQAGDIFRVEVFNGQVRYRKNGVVFFTSNTAPTYPLGLDVSLHDEGATVTSAQVTSCAAGDTSCMPPGFWKNVRYAPANGALLTRSPGWGWHAGASSVEQIDAGDGFVEFSTSEATLQKMAGLNSGDADQGYGDIDYAIFLRGDGGLEVYEQGVGQGYFGTYAAGDVFRVEAFNGQVRYRKNGLVFFTSNTAPTYPLGLDTSLHDEGATVTSALVTSCAAGDTSCMPPGQWRNVRHATANGGLLTRVPGWGWHAGASSVEQIDAGDGFVEFSTNEANLQKMAGLNSGDGDQGYGDIDYAIFLRADGGLEIYEQGVGQGYFGTYQPGDVFRVEVFNGQVRYRQNGMVFHTSNTAPTYPLGLDTSLHDEGATVTSALVMRCAAGDESCMPPQAWKNVRHAIANGSLLTRDAGWGWHAGASSVEQIEAGDGFVEFSTNETDLQKMAGLGHGDADQGYGDIEYAIFLRDDGGVEILEQGVGQGYFGTYAAGDVFRVEVFNGQVRYRQNGMVFHTSNTAPTYPLGLDTSLHNEGATVTSALVTSCAAGDTSCMPPGLWKNVRHTTANGGLLTRDAGWGWHAGASSAEQIEAGDGFLEFSTNEANLQKMAGLSHGDADQGYGDIDYAIFLRADGGLEVFEQGVGQGYFGTYQAGDVFRVEVFDGQVRYRKNGVVFHTSTTAPTYPLGLDTSLHDEGATITGAEVTGCAVDDASCMPPGFWKNVRYAPASGSTLTRAAGWGWHAGASSVHEIDAGDGFVEFSTNETNRYKMAGLGHADDSQHYGDIDHAIYLHGDGAIEVVEHGYGHGFFGTYQAGDVFRVEVLGGQVRYLKNGTVLYTSATAPTYPLALDTSLYDEGATITNATISGAGTGGPTTGCGEVGPGDELSDTKVPTFCNHPTTMPDGSAPPMGQYFGHTCTSVEIQTIYYENTSGKHSGLDFSVPARAPLYSVGYGQVMCAGPNACTNRFPIARGAPAQIDLTIRYGSVYVIYGHAASSLVAEGDLVVPGQEIGESSDWPGNDHLHFEVRRVADNKAPNPVPFFSPDIRSYLEGTVTDAHFCRGHFDDQADVSFTTYPQLEERPCTDANDGTTGPIRCQELCSPYSLDNCDDHEYCSVFACGGGTFACGLRRNTAAQACQ